jgi:hypothetical protein
MLVLVVITSENSPAMTTKTSFPRGHQVLWRHYAYLHRSIQFTVVPIEVFLKYWFNTLPQADQFISSSSSRYSYTSCERANSKNLIISGHFLSIYDWLVEQTTKVIGAFKLFNRKFTIILGSVLNISRNLIKWIGQPEVMYWVNIWGTLQLERQ